MKNRLLRMLIVVLGAIIPYIVGFAVEFQFQHTDQLMIILWLKGFVITCITILGMVLLYGITMILLNLVHWVWHGDELILVK